MSKTKEEKAEFLALLKGVSTAATFEIAKYIDKIIDQEKRSAAALAIAWVLNNTDGRTSLDIERTVSEYINSL